MSDNTTGSGAQAVPPPQPQAAHPPFPAVRLLYAVGFGILAYIVLFALFAISVVQFVVLAINGRVNDELKGFSINLVQYLWELIAFITFVRDEQPFPLGPFPRHS
jgi:Domain of unknown function (DUF4389)